MQALGRIDSIDRHAYTVTVETPLSTPNAVDAIHLGDVCLDPGTYEDEPR